MGGVTKINTDSPVTELAVARWELSLKYKSKLCASIYWILSSCSPKFRTIRVCQHHISRRQDFAPNEHQPPTVYCLQQTLKLYYPGIFSCKNYCSLIQISPKFVPMRPIWNNQCWFCLLTRMHDLPSMSLRILVMIWRIKFASNLNSTPTFRKFPNVFIIFSILCCYV